MGFILFIVVFEEVFNCLILFVEVYVFGGLGVIICCFDIFVGEVESAINFVKEFCIVFFSFIILNGWGDLVIVISVFWIVCCNRLVLIFLDWLIIVVRVVCRICWNLVVLNGVVVGKINLIFRGFEVVVVGFVFGIWIFWVSSLVKGILRIFCVGELVLNGFVIMVFCEG